jgi:hypothetical protein
MSRLLAAVPLLVLTAAVAVEPDPQEWFTLDDGRVILGSYDERSGVLVVSGTIRARLRVTPQQIVRRVPATGAGRPAPVAPASRPEDARRAQERRLEDLRADAAACGRLVLRAAAATAVADARVAAWRAYAATIVAISRRRAKLGPEMGYERVLEHRARCATARAATEEAEAADTLAYEQKLRAQHARLLEEIREGSGQE